MRSKAHLFPEPLADLAAAARALAHPARLQILDILARRKTCICDDLASELPLAQATVSQHLKILKKAGFVEGEVDGPRVCYCIAPAALAAVREDFGAFFSGLGPDVCGAGC